MGRVQFNQRFWFAYPDISRDEWMRMNDIFWDFLNKGQLRELYPKFWSFLTVNFRSIQLTFLPDVTEFSVEWVAYQIYLDALETFHGY